MSRADRILLEFDPDATPVSGRLSVASAAPVPFIGWTALFAMLRMLAGADAPAPAPTTDQER